MRTLKVFSITTQDTTEINFTGTTFGDLKHQMGISSNNVVGRGRTTKTKYEINDSILNPEDTFIFISPKKQELGGINLDDLEMMKEKFLNEVDSLFDELEDKILSTNNDNCDTPDCLEDELRQLEERERTGK